MAHGRALTIQNLIDYKPKTMGFTGTWLNMLGDPEPFGSWIIYGGSGQGKTRFTLQLTKYLMSFNGIRVAYDSLEEGVSETYKRAIIDTGVHTERHGQRNHREDARYIAEEMTIVVILNKVKNLKSTTLKKSCAFFKIGVKFYCLLSDKLNREESH